MGRIQSSIGLITGVPITDTVDQLIAISAQPRDALQARTNLLQSEQVAIAELTAAVIAVQLTGNGLGVESIFDKTTASTSDEGLLSAAVSGSPVAGSYQFTPLQTAQTQQFLSSGLSSLDEPLGEGSISLARGGFLTDAIALTQLNGGDGVARGKIRITDRSGGTAEIDLRFAGDVEDVLDAINNAAGIDVTATVEGDAIRLSDQTGQAVTNLRVAEVGGGSTAADLGLAGIDAAADDALGGDVVRLDDGILLSELNDGNGVSLRPGVDDLTITFRDGSADLKISFSDLADPENRDSATLGDLLDALNAADPARLQASISADGDYLELTDLTADSGGTFSVASADGGSVAEELGLTSAAVGDTIAGRRLQSGLRDTLLTSLGGGGGLGALGQLDLTDRSGAAASVDLSSAETLGGVIQTINNAGIGIIAQINGAGSGILLRDISGGTGNLQIANGDGTNTADKLQLTTDAAQSSADSGALRRQFVSRQTKLADYNGGAGVAAGQFIITDSQGANAAIDVDEDSVTTIGDLLDLINAAGIGVSAGINAAGDGIQLTDTAGGSQTLTVEDVNHGTAADLFIAGDAESGTIDGSTAAVIEISDSDTLQDFVDKLNDAGLPLAATIFDAGGGATPYHISIVGQQSGLDGRLLIDTSDAGFSLSEIVAAQDARLLFGSISSGGIVTTSSDNRFEDIPAGVDLTIHSASTTPVSVTVASTDSSFVSAAKSLVSAFNGLKEKIDEYTFFNETDNTTGVLFGSNETLRIESEITRLFTDRAYGFGDVQTLEQLGVSLTEDGSLELDENKLKAAFANNPDDVKAFFTDEDRGFAAKLNALADTLAGADNSLLISRTQSLSAKVDLYQERIDFMTERLDHQRELLLTQFYNMETTIAKLQDSLSVVQSIAALPPLVSTNSN